MRYHSYMLSHKRSNEQVKSCNTYVHKRSLLAKLPSFVLVY